MKLCYRGVRYDSTPPTLEMTESEILATYRGQSYHVTYPRHMTVLQPVAEFKYRGVPYRTTETGRIETADGRPVAATPTTATEISLSEVARIHRDNLCQRLSERIAAAKAQGNQQLLEILEQESEQLVCSR
ncbi:DUF4278 domain-containing protein [Baaleninema simplex]|uniref:DUF4278 domain-containing protein n=1 Tax=Baaleninema simplex TaxID=2862350 RepID=UPI00034BD5FB|nr:DUF4278 domain-containing protein [Baaleninema simplex]